MSIIRVKTRQKSDAVRTDNGKIALTIPEGYYRYLEFMGEFGPKEHEYRTWVNKMVAWLSEQAPNAYKVIRLHGSTVVLEKTDDRFYDYWTKDVLLELSERFGLRKLWDKVQSDL